MMEIGFLQRKTVSQIAAENSRWSPWFAWVPVYDDSGRCFMWETVERRAYVGKDLDGPYVAWKYRRKAK